MSDFFAFALLLNAKVHLEIVCPRYHHYKSFLECFIIIITIYAYTGGRNVDVSASGHKIHKNVLDPLELELKVVMGA